MFLEKIWNLVPGNFLIPEAPPKQLKIFLAKTHGSKTNKKVSDTHLTCVQNFNPIQSFLSAVVVKMFRVYCKHHWVKLTEQEKLSFKIIRNTKNRPSSN